MAVDRVLKPREVAVRCGFSETTLYRQINAGDFPRPQQISPGVTGWRSSTIREWIKSRPNTAEIELPDDPRESERLVGLRTARRPIAR
jgi:prophage regulatory protein